MDFFIEGKLIVKQDVQEISATFKKREFVVEYIERNPEYPQLISFQLVQDRTDRIEPYNVGDQIRVKFNLRGRKWTAPDGVDKYFNSLEAWQIEAAGANGGQAPAPAPATAQSTPSATNHESPEVEGMSDGDDDLPF